jgi:hypothetical protein
MLGWAEQLNKKSSAEIAAVKVPADPFHYNLSHIFEGKEVLRPNRKKNMVYGTLCRSLL